MSNAKLLIKIPKNVQNINELSTFLIFLNHFTIHGQQISVSIFVNFNSRGISLCCLAGVYSTVGI